jgi:hypothetical protein
MMEKFGIKQHVITNTESRDKRPDMSTEQGREIVRDQLDEIFDVFKDRMISGGVSAETIKELAGRVVLTRSAIESGLCESVLGQKTDIDGTQLTSDTESVSDDAGDSDHNQPPADIAGTTQEDAMNLQEAIAQNPAITEEIEAIKAESFSAGAASEKEAVTARIESAKSYLANDAYPSAVSDLAVKVVVGDAGKEALDACVTMWDASKESANSESAKEETEEMGDTPPESPIENSADKTFASEEETLRKMGF